MEKICVLKVETGQSFSLVPTKDAKQSAGAKFSPNGARLCYTMVDRKVRGAQPEVYIREFDPADFIRVTCIQFPSCIVIY